jgi:hypothetical protein
MRLDGELDLTKRSPSRTLRRWLPISFAIAVTLLLGNADAWAKGNVPPPPPAASKPAAPDPSLPEVQLARDLAAIAGVSFDDMYAEREKEARALEAFRGGDVVVISSTTVIIVLLIILILVVA